MEICLFVTVKTSNAVSRLFMFYVWTGLSCTVRICRQSTEVSPVVLLVTHIQRPRSIIKMYYSNITAEPKAYVEINTMFEIIFKYSLNLFI